MITTAPCDDEPCTADRPKGDASHCSNDEQAVALNSVAHGRNCNILLHMRRRCAHRRCSESCSQPGRHKMTLLSWILMAIDVTASDIDWLRWNALARLRPTIASTVSECRLAIEYSATTLDSTTELRMIDVTLMSTIALSGESNTVSNDCSNAVLTLLASCKTSLPWRSHS
jgi:hypothetical protein